MKKWLCAWLALLLLISLTACGGGAEESGATESPDLLDVSRGARRSADAAESDDMEDILSDIEGMLADNRKFKEFPDASISYAGLYDDETVSDDGGQSDEIPADEETLADMPAYEESPAHEQAPVYEETPAPAKTPAPTESPAPAKTPAPVESPAPEETPAPVESPAPEETPAPVESPAPEEPPAPVEPRTVSEDGSYTTKEDVALYLHLYQRLPDNFITKEEARELGWNGGSLEPYVSGKCIGGDYFGNYEGLLPEGHSYHECDIDTLGAKSRGAKRLVYSDDGLIYYTDDHYNTFTLLYAER